MIDKNKVMIEFLRNCPVIDKNPLYFNFGNIEDNSYQIVTESNDTSLSQPYIDGSILKRYTFYIDCFKTIAYNKVIKGYQDENLYDISEVQAILDWVNEQDKNKIYPDFGEDCLIDSMQSTTESPDVLSVEDTTTSPIAVYRISIQIDYIDNTQKLDFDF